MSVLASSSSMDNIKDLFHGLAIGGASRQVVAAAAAAVARCQSSGSVRPKDTTNLELISTLVAEASKVDSSIQHVGDLAGPCA